MESSGSVRHLLRDGSSRVLVNRPILRTGSLKQMVDDKYEKSHPATGPPGTLESRMDGVERHLERLEGEVDKEWVVNEAEFSHMRVHLFEHLQRLREIEGENKRDIGKMQERLAQDLQTVIEGRRGSMEKLSFQIEDRMARIRSSMLEEYKALRSRPGGLAGVVSRMANAPSDVRQQVEHLDAAVALSDDRMAAELRLRLDEVAAALLRERVAREQDEERVQVLAEKVMLDLQRAVTDNEREREKVEGEMLEVIRGVCERVIPRGERGSGGGGGASARR